MYSHFFSIAATPSRRFASNRPENANAVTANHDRRSTNALDAIEKTSLHSRGDSHRSRPSVLCRHGFGNVGVYRETIPPPDQENSRRIAKMLRRIWEFPQAR